MSSDIRLNEPTSKGKRSALGRGLSALIPDMDELNRTPSESEYFLCDVDRIRVNPYQPRIRIGEEELEELARSIREQGIVQPIVVRKTEMGYELVAGERRLRAARRVGLAQVPVVVKDIPDNKMLELSIIENIQREALNPIEEAEAYHRLMTEFGLTQEDVADRVGKSRPAVANFLRLRQLPEMIRSSVLNGEISMGHARALLGAQNEARRLEAWRAVVEKKLSVRQTEALVRKLNRPDPPVRMPTCEDIQIQSVTEALSRGLGTRVAIRKKGKTGKLEIAFSSDEELNRLIDLLNRSIDPGGSTF